MTATAEYTDFLRTLSEGSVRKHFDAFEDIAWDDPEFAVVPNDPRWVLPKVDPLGSHDWYLALPLERQIEIGMARQACIAKVGWQFESVLIRGILEYTFWAKNNDPQFRYLMHEVTEKPKNIASIGFRRRSAQSSAQRMSLMSQVPSGSAIAPRIARALSSRDRDSAATIPASPAVVSASASTTSNIRATLRPTTDTLRVTTTYPATFSPG